MTYDRNTDPACSARGRGCSPLGRNVVHAFILPDALAKSYARGCFGGEAEAFLISHLSTHDLEVFPAGDHGINISLFMVRANAKDQQVVRQAPGLGGHAPHQEEPRPH